MRHGDDKTEIRSVFSTHMGEARAACPLADANGPSVMSRLPEHYRSYNKRTFVCLGEIVRNGEGHDRWKLEFDMPLHYATKKELRTALPGRFSTVKSAVDAAKKSGAKHGTSTNPVSKLVRQAGQGIADFETFASAAHDMRKRVTSSATLAGDDGGDDEDNYDDDDDE
eukprot:6087006-Prymnesium_polylepis.1